MSIKLVVGAVAAMLAAGGLISLGPQAVVLTSSPADSVPSAARLQSSAAVAAACAGFPAPVVAEINQHFDPEKWLDVNVVEHYDMKWVAVDNVTRACAPVSPKPLQLGLRPVPHATGVVDHDDLLGQALPVYVVAELENVPVECGCRVFATIRLPMSAAPPEQQPRYEGPPPRIA